MGGKGSKSKAPAPDPNIGIAASQQAKIAGEWLDFSKEAYADMSRRQDGIDALTKQVTEQQLNTQNQANSWAAEDRGRYKSIFQPMEDQYVQDAKDWDSVGRQEKLGAEAKADVLNNAAQQRAASQRNMSAMGVDPTSGRYEGVNRSGEQATALAAAGAQNSSRNQVRQQGAAMRADALNMGKGLPSQAAASAGLGLSAGNSALAGNMGAAQLAGGNTSIMNSGFGGAQSGYAGQANTLNQQYQGQLSAWATQQQAGSANTGAMMGGLGSMAGMGMSMMSSEEVKENKTPVRGALKAINNLRVEQWDYKEGAGDGGRHIGAYAEDFQRETGRGDGKSIPIVDAIGVNMKATQELSEQVEQVAAAVQKLGKGINRPQPKKAQANG